MAKVLISCIGTGALIKDSDDSLRHYRTAKYVFDENNCYETSFVADAIVQNYDIDKIILIGTVKSMWEEVYEKFSKHDDIDIDLDYYTELGSFCENADHTTPIKNFPDKNKLEKSLGIGSKIVLINYGLNTQELTENSQILLNIEKEINDGDELYIDITHSFRSIPLYMMNLLNYMKLVSNKKIVIKKISYGMLDISREMDGKVPVIDLTSVLTVQDWLIAAYSFREYGEAYKTAELLKQDGRNAECNTLTTFSDVMNLNYMYSIRSQVNALQSIASQTANHNPLAKIILPKIITNFREDFNNEENNEARFQLNVAKWNCEHRKYAASFLAVTEAIITYIRQNKNLSDDEAGINKAKDILKQAINKPNSCNNEIAKQYFKIKKIRNKIAHASSTQSNPTSQMINFLKTAIKELEQYIR